MFWFNAFKIKDLTIKGQLRLLQFQEKNRRARISEGISKLKSVIKVQAYNGDIEASYDSTDVAQLRAMAAYFDERHFQTNIVTIDNANKTTRLIVSW